MTFYARTEDLFSVSHFEADVCYASIKGSTLPHNMRVLLLDRAENIVTKGEIAHY